MNIIVNPDYPITLNLDTLFYEEETSDSKEVVILFSLARSIFNICC